MDEILKGLIITLLAELIIRLTEMLVDITSEDDK